MKGVNRGCTDFNEEKAAGTYHVIFLGVARWIREQDQCLGLERSYSLVILNVIIFRNIRIARMIQLCILMI